MKILVRILIIVLLTVLLLKVGQAQHLSRKERRQAERNARENYYDFKAPGLPGVIYKPKNTPRVKVVLLISFTLGFGLTRHFAPVIRYK